MNRDVKVKLLVVGDSGVGKSQLVTVLTQDKAKTNQSKWTIGANTEVAIHIYKECLIKCRIKVILLVIQFSV